MEEREENEEKKSKKLLIVLLGTAVFAIIGTILYSTLIRAPRHYSGYTIEKKSERGSVIDTKYFENDGRLITYNREGVFAIGADTSVLWNAGISYKNPKVVAAGEYVAVVDIGGKSLSFMNGRTTPVNVVTKELQGTVLDVSVSEEGQVAVLMSEKHSNLIQIIEPFNRNTEIKAEIKTYQKEDGYGLLVAISPDGTKLVTEYVNREGTELKSVLTFYNFGKTGESTNADRIVGIFPYSDTLFGKLQFLNNTTLLAAGDNKLLCFGMKHEPILKFEKGIHGKVTRVDGDESGIGLILLENNQKTSGKEFLDEALADKTGEYFIRVTHSGDIVFEKELPFKRSGLAYRRGEALLYSDESCLILNADGSEKFKTAFTENLLKMFHTKKGDRYYMITGAHIIMLKLNE